MSLISPFGEAFLRSAPALVVVVDAFAIVSGLVVCSECGQVVQLLKFSSGSSRRFAALGMG